MQTLELSPQVFSILGGLIEERVGLHYSLLDRDLLREKASMRAIEAGFNSLLDYYYFLRYDSAYEKELNELVETLVVNETYFFREWVGLKSLVENFIAPMCKAGRRPKIWSAACATGEEPLSLAMLLHSQNLLDQVEIVATDISARVITKAKLGKFGRRAVRTVPENHLPETYLTPLADGYQIQARLIQAIKWGQHNLIEPGTSNHVLNATTEPFDFVICRNVLIYFSDHTVTSVLNNIAEVLRPGGMLLVGVSESLLRYGGIFAGEEHGGAFIYRKPFES